MIDTHCHIYAEQFEDDLAEVLDRAAQAGVDHIFMPAINFDSLPKMEQIAHLEITFHKMAGIHPTDINEGTRTTEEELYGYCSQDDIVGVGETGLDYYWSDEYKSDQEQSLRIHCKVAKQLGKPIVLHNRDSTDELLNIIEDEQDGNLRGVWHSFTGLEEEGERAIDIGLALGIGGIFTFKNAGVDEAVAKLPLQHMILETDAPYLAPDPKRGKRNEPSFVKYTAQKLAEVQGFSFEKTVQITTSNALELFGISS
ncbi:TatD DNase family protein [Fodinibius salinus]|uniref:TatD DNase family protein n=1 Tax=Fodinibius salinus TaxID=860790 RepID=A0A5D3YH18_9BACT|nr:TatD family hydrolase [Fodinibius salinus]TYP92614.1 TatD DNase family protein [Fodinibius salinus]